MPKKYKTEKERRAAKQAQDKEYYYRNYLKVRERRKQRDKEFQAKKLDYKKGLECANPDCNFLGAWNPAKIEFHHLDPAKKKFNPYKAGTWKAFIKEVKKCVPLCKDCHTYLEAWKAKRKAAELAITDPVPF